MPKNFAAVVGLGLAAIVCAAACAHPAPPPVAPGPPIPADPPGHLDSMATECDALFAAFKVYRDCTNLEDEMRDGIDDWVEHIRSDVAAASATTKDANEQRTIAAACHRAQISVRDAGIRCAAGKAPRQD